MAEFIKLPVELKILKKSAEMVFIMLIKRI